MIVKWEQNGIAKENYRRLFDSAAIKIGATKIIPTGEDGSPLRDEYGRLIETVDKEDDLYVEDFNEYLLTLQTIMKDDSLTEKQSKFYTIIPLSEEPMFEVNANTREIKVPQELKTLGVVGDNAAEIVYFCIDRYFDTTDFASDDITAVVEWKRGTDSGLSATWTKDETVIPGKVVIGWPIGGLLTEEPGTVEFALRLYQLDSAKKLMFNFNTLTARATIAKTLSDEDMSTAIPDQIVDNLISQRIKLQKYPQSDASTVPAPEITHNIGDAEEGYIVYDKIGALQNAYYKDLNENNELLVEVEGHSDHPISYQWYKRDGNSWIEISNETDPVIELSAVGIYACQIKATRVANDYNTKFTNILYVLGPEIPYTRITDNDAANKTENGDIYMSRHFSGENLTTTLTPLPGLKKADNTYVYFDNTYDKNNVTEIQYKWTRQDGAVTSEVDTVPGENGSILVDKEGMYRCQIGLVRNGSEPALSDLKTRTTYWVTKDLIEPKILTDFNVYVGQVNPETNEFEYEKDTPWAGTLDDIIRIKFNNTYKHEYIYYQWYEIGDVLNTPERDIYIEGSCGRTNNGEINFKPTRPGGYTLRYLVVRNRNTWPQVEGLATNEDSYNEYIKTNLNGQRLVLNIENDNNFIRIDSK